MNPLVYFWFRRDLRLQDNAGLYHALKSGTPVCPVFVFDNQILQQLEDKKDARVNFIYQQVAVLKRNLQELKSDLIIYHGSPGTVWPEIFDTYGKGDIYTNEDYEPLAIKRDSEISEFASRHHMRLHTFKDQVIFSYNEVLKPDGNAYTVFTPYSKKWKEKLNTFYLKSYPSENYQHRFFKIEKPGVMPTLESLGFEPNAGDLPPASISQKVILEYAQNRDFPSLPGTSRLGLHLRFGTISIREKVRKGLKLSEKWVDELIWREFYMMILAHFPDNVNHAFKKEYDQIDWENNLELFEKWCEGKTGYPLVDAGMRELKQTGFMHNRVRMVVASFLTKHLLIDWRWGEAWFAKHLLDFELASNNGGWQWCAGCGCDAAPYFRIFNPTLQLQRFDPTLVYVKKWVPEYGTANYVKPIVDHEFARKRCLEKYKQALNK